MVIWESGGGLLNALGGQQSWDSRRGRDCSEQERNSQTKLCCYSDHTLSPYSPSPPTPPLFLDSFTEARLSVAPEMDIMDYCKKEWRGNTQKATCMKKV